MQTRRDQVDAYLYQHTRLVSAIMSGRPDPVEVPARRDRMGLITGLAAAALAVLIAVAVGLFRGPAAGALRADPGTLIVDSRSGSRYLLLDGVLHPVANLASARLYTGRDLRIKTVKAKALAGLPHGRPLGIPGAPDTLPAPGAINQGVWRACSVGGGAGTGGGGPAGRLVLQLGVRPVAEFPMADAALLVTAAGTDHLLWHGTRLRVPGRQVEGLLGYGGVAHRAVAPRWLALVPAGPDLAMPPLPGAGGPGPVVAGRVSRIGQLFQVDTGAARPSFSMAVRGGLAALSPLDAVLAQAAAPPPAPGRPVVTRVTAADVGGLPVKNLTRAGAFPSVPPALTGLPAGTAPCLRQAAGGTGARPVLVVTAVPDDVPVLRVEPGQGALVSTGAGVAGQGTLLITDEGVGYPLARPEDLGYSAKAVVSGLEPFASLVPRGVEVSVAAISAPVPAVRGTAGTRGTVVGGTVAGGTVAGGIPATT